MSDSYRCLLLNKHLSPHTPHITPIAYPSDLDKADLVSLPTTITPSSTPEEKKQAKKQKTTPKSHWMTNAGYALYAGVGAIKTVSSLQRAIGHDNPTLILGNIGLLASFPAVFMSHGFYAKAAMLVANHLSEMAEAAVGYNDRVTSAANEAKKHGNRVKPFQTTGLPGMKTWLNGDLLKRYLTFSATPTDHQNMRAFFAYVGKDLKHASKQAGASIQAGGKLLQEVGKKVVKPSHQIRLPERFHVDSLAKGDARNIQIQRNLFHAETTGAFGGIVGVGIETLAETLGVNHIAKIFTRPALLVANLLQTTGALCSAKQIWLRTDVEKQQSTKFKNLAYQEAGGTVLEAVGAASWSNDWLLGIYRLGSLLRMPYRKYKTLLEKDAEGNIVEVKVITPKIKTALRSENLSFLVDGVAAVLILGAPLVAWWEKKHHTTLNPIERSKHKPTSYKKPIQKPTVVHA
ncbi:MAG: hypothetical protein ACK551_07150 [Vampirovibrionales bacterium]